MALNLNCSLPCPSAADANPDTREDSGVAFKLDTPAWPTCIEVKDDSHPQIFSDQCPTVADSPHLVQDPLLPFSPSPTVHQSSLSPQCLDSFQQFVGFLETEILGCVVPSERRKKLRTVLECAETLASIGGEKGWIPQLSTDCSFPCQHCCIARPKEPRQVILDRAAKERIVKGKPSSMSRLLAGYGRKEYPLGGQLATTSVLEGDSRCDSCKAKNTPCVIVERDKSWKRNQCVVCVQRKRKCSLDTARQKRERAVKQARFKGVKPSSDCVASLSPDATGS